MSEYTYDLKELAVAFERLLDIEYIITLKSKSSDSGTKEIHVCFLRENLYHLAGMQHFNDVEILKPYREHRKSSRDFFYAAKYGEITSDDIAKSAKYSESVAKRLSYLQKIEEIFDTNKMIFSFNGIVQGKNHEYRSFVRADYLLKNKGEENDMAFVFLKRKDKDSSDFSPISLFCPKDDYSRGQHEECLLIKKKFLKGNKTEILYIHPSFLKFHPEVVEIC